MLEALPARPYTAAISGAERLVPPTCHQLEWPGASAYAASKAALIGMIKSTAQELRNYNVRANVLSPGVRATPIFMDVSTETEREHYRSSIGIGEPEGVIPTLLYLISDASANLTGAVLEHRFTPVNEQTQ